MATQHTESDRYNVTVYLDNGSTETHKNVSAARARELEGDFDTYENVTCVEVRQA